MYPVQVLDAGLDGGGGGEEDGGGLGPQLGRVPEAGALVQLQEDELGGDASHTLLGAGVMGGR